MTRGGLGPSPDPSILADPNLLIPSRILSPYPPTKPTKPVCFRGSTSSQLNSMGHVSGWVGERDGTASEDEATPLQSKLVGLRKADELFGQPPFA